MEHSPLKIIVDLGIRIGNLEKEKEQLSKKVEYQEKRIECLEKELEAHRPHISNIQIALERRNELRNMGRTGLFANLGAKN